MIQSAEQKAAAFLLSDRIIIETMFKKGGGTWYSSKKNSSIDIDINSSQLGKCVYDHLNESKEQDTPIEQMRNNWKELIKRAGFKTEKEFINMQKE